MFMFLCCPRGRRDTLDKKSTYLVSPAPSKPPRFACGGQLVVVVHRLLLRGSSVLCTGLLPRVLCVVILPLVKIQVIIVEDGFVSFCFPCAGSARFLGLLYETASTGSYTY